jgi:hypothetical protein|tara:strand:+ start:440 stop:817 length:378 start_codon:yes stop_codon:yes gene_type:complete
MPSSEIPPFMWQVWFKGNKKPMEMSGFDEEHIRLMCKPAKVMKVKRMPEEKEDFTPMERLGPKDAKVNQPADYDRGFKLLKDWVDSIGGPPEELRKRLRELFIDYHKPTRKTTRYSHKKRGQHKI